MTTFMSKKMCECQAFAEKQFHNRLYRHPGGYWTDYPYLVGSQSPVPKKYFSTNTVNALIQRGVFEVVERLPRKQPSIVELS